MSGKKLSDFTMKDVVEQSLYALAALLIFIGIVVLISWLAGFWR